MGGAWVWCPGVRPGGRHVVTQFPHLNSSLPRHHGFIYSQAQKQEGNLSHKWLSGEVSQDSEWMRTAEQRRSIAREQSGMMNFPATQVATKGREFLFHCLRGKETCHCSLVSRCLFPRGWAFTYMVAEFGGRSWAWISQALLSYHCSSQPVYVTHMSP